MSKKSTSVNEGHLKSNEEERKGHVHIDWGRQGTVIFAYIVVLLGYYGIPANIILINEIGEWISYTEMDPTVLFWTYKFYSQCYFIPIFLLFLISFLLTYKEDIPHYGIKASLWLVPTLIAEGFLFYWIMNIISGGSFGFFAEPFILQFAHAEGYFNIIILYACTLTGALSGMKLKQFIVLKRKDL